LTRFLKDWTNAVEYRHGAHEPEAQDQTESQTAPQEQEASHTQEAQAP